MVLRRWSPAGAAGRATAARVIISFGDEAAYGGLKTYDHIR